MQKRQRPWFYLTSLAMIAGLGFLFFLPNQIVAPTGLSAPFTAVYMARLPEILIVLGLGYGGYIILCLLLALDVVMHPGRTARVMGELARQRAQPWLAATTIALLFVTMVVAALILIWVVYLLRYRGMVDLVAFLNILAEFDLILLICVTVAIICLGQAAVTYEVFTGKTLPRGGLTRHWQRILLLGSSYSIVVSILVSFPFPTLHLILFLTIVAVSLVALFNWRSYEDHERTINSLRPFITSQRLYENFLGETPTSGDDLRPAFYALCRDVIGAETAYLMPWGHLATLVSTPLTYPINRSAPDIADLPLHFATPQAPSLPVSAKDFGGAQWAIPLWSERGLIGLFLLGRKIDGQLYTQEEMNIARASGERLIDTQASAEMARRLIGLQRQKMAESQLLDQKTRRILHDDVLPLLHTALLDLSVEEEDGEAVGLITSAHKQISELLRQMPTTAAEPLQKGGLIHALRRLLDYEMPHLFDEVIWEIEPAVETQAPQIPQLTAEVVYYAAREVLRNAAKHGRVSPDHHLCVTLFLRWRDGLEIQIEDNGGVQAPLVTSDSNSKPAVLQAGAGEGLNLHTTMLAVVGGQLTLETQENVMTRVTIYIPAASLFLRQ